MTPFHEKQDKILQWLRAKGYTGTPQDAMYSYVKSKSNIAQGTFYDHLNSALWNAGYTSDILDDRLTTMFISKTGILNRKDAERNFFSNFTNDMFGIQFVASAQKISTDFNAATTTAIDTRSANFIVVYGCAVTIGVLTDSQSNTWTKLTTRTNGGAFNECALYYCANPTKSATHTFTYTLSSGAPSLSVLAFSGVATSSPFDVENGAIFTATTSVATGSITPSVNNEVVVTGLAPGTTSGSYTADSGMTNIGYIPTVGGQGYGTGIAYKIQTTAAAINPTWSGPSGSGSVAIASFKAG